MSRILAAWEMGANMGHIDRMLVSARALRERGHEVVFALRDLSRAQARVAAQGFAMLQAPVWLPRLANPPRLGNYSAVLASAGWLDGPGLAGLLSGWRALYRLVGAQAIISDHAPTAMLAARDSGMVSWAIGNSFEIPPPGSFFPSMRLGDPVDTARCAGYDATVLAPANQALALLGLPPLPRLTDLFLPVRQAIASLPELAHYDGYPSTTVWAGPCYVGDVGAAPLWPAAAVVGAPRVFVYLSPTHPGFRPVIQALRALDVPALVHAKGLSAEAGARLGGARIRFEPAPLQMDPAASQADIVVSHASLGTATAALLAGKPQLLLPSHAEQGMVARRIVAAGCGLAMPVLADAPLAVGAAAPDALALLQRLLEQDSFASSARALAARHAGTTPQQTGQMLAALIEASL